MNEHDTSTADPGNVTPVGVPMARPVQITHEAVPAPWPPPMSAGWAVVELILVAILPQVIGGLTYSLLPAMHFEDDRWLTLIATATIGCTALLVCGALLVIDGQKPVTIGWRFRPVTDNVAVGLVGLVLTLASRMVLVICAMLLYPPLARELDEAEQAIEQTLPPMNLPVLAAAMTFVVIWEEVVFRGFLLTRLQAVFKRWWLSIGAGSVLFGLIHFYQGPLAMILISVMAVILSILFVWRKSLLPCMVLHWLHNVGVLLLLQVISPHWR